MSIKKLLAILGGLAVITFAFIGVMTVFNPLQNEVVVPIGQPPMDEEAFDAKDFPEFGVATVEECLSRDPGAIMVRFNGDNSVLDCAVPPGIVFSVSPDVYIECYGLGDTDWSKESCLPNMNSGKLEVALEECPDANVLLAHIKRTNLAACFPPDGWWEFFIEPGDEVDCYDITLSPAEKKECPNAIIVAALDPEKVELPKVTAPCDKEILLHEYFTKKTWCLNYGEKFDGGEEDGEYPDLYYICFDPKTFDAQPCPSEIYEWMEGAETEGAMDI